VHFFASIFIHNLLRRDLSLSLARTAGVEIDQNTEEIEGEASGRKNSNLN
jgi:hypothetical protein